MSFANMPLYTGDYLRDTRHLTPEEHGIYLLLLMHCWDQKGPVPLDERKQAGIVNARSGGEIESLRRVLGEYFVQMEDGWYNPRMQAEVAKAEALSSKNRANGLASVAARRTAVRAKRAADRSLDLPLSDPDPARLTTVQRSLNDRSAVAGNPNPNPILTEKKRTKNLSAAPTASVGFDAFWQAYPHCPGRSSRKEAVAMWADRKCEPDAAKILALVRHDVADTDWTRDARRYVPAAHRWLKRELWRQADPAADFEPLLDEAQRQGYTLVPVGS